MPMSPRLLRPIANSLDPDAAVYLNAVAQADQQQLEPAVRKAINDFVVGCKRDGIWSAIKASCILMGARTLSGALTPLVGAAPTNTNFVSGDYNRKTGLLGNGTNKSLDSNRNNNADPQNSRHVGLYVSAIATNSPIPCYFGGDGASGSTQIVDASGFAYRINSTSGQTGAAFAVGFLGIGRNNSSQSSSRQGGVTATVSDTSASPTNFSSLIFRRTTTSGVSFANARMAFYSIGESLDLALLDSRATTLYNAIGAAI